MPERVSNRAHAEHNVQIIPHSIDKKTEYSLAVALVHTRLLCIGTATGHDLFILLWFEQIRYFATIQDIVDILQELLEHDLRIREQEYRVFVLDACLLVEELKIVVKGLVVVAAAQLDLEALVAVDVAGKAGQGLLACAAHAHEQGVAAALADDARDARDVLHGVHEEDHFDLFVVFEVEVVLVVGVNGLEALVVGDVLVEAVGFVGAHLHEVAEDDRRLAEELGFDLLFGARMELK